MKNLKQILAGKSHIIWDWNGTLLDDVHLCIDIVSGIAERHGAQTVTRESYLKKFRFPVIEYYKELGFDLNRTSYEHLSKEFFHAYKNNVHLTRLHAGMAELIAELSDSGIKSSVLSAAKEEDLLGMLEHFNIKHLFEYIYGVSDHLAHGKIARGLDLLSKINLPPSQIVLVGDTDHDAEVADSLGVDAILLDGGHQCPDRLTARKLVVLSRKSLASLARE